MKFKKKDRVRVIGGTSRKLKGKCGNITLCDKVEDVEFYGVNFPSINEGKMFTAEELEKAEKYER